MSRKGDTVEGINGRVRHGVPEFLLLRGGVERQSSFLSDVQLGCHLVGGSAEQSKSAWGPEDHPHLHTALLSVATTREGAKALRASRSC